MHSRRTLGSGLPISTLFSLVLCGAGILRGKNVGTPIGVALHTLSTASFPSLLVCQTEVWHSRLGKARWDSLPRTPCSHRAHLLEYRHVSTGNNSTGTPGSLVGKRCPLVRTAGGLIHIAPGCRIVSWCCCLWRRRRWGIEYLSVERRKSRLGHVEERALGTALASGKDLRPVLMKRRGIRS